MATENIMMDAVKAGGDRQELHEKIRTLSMEAGRAVKEEGADNDLLERIAADPAFGLSGKDLSEILDPKEYTGCCGAQVTRCVEEEVQPLLAANADVLGMKAEINV